MLTIIIIILITSYLLFIQNAHDTALRKENSYSHAKEMGKNMPLIFFQSEHYFYYGKVLTQQKEHFTPSSQLSLTLYTENEQPSHLRRCDLVADE